MRHAIAIVLLAALASASSGCTYGLVFLLSERNYSVTGQCRYWCGYVRDGEYELLVDALVVTPQHMREHVLVVPGPGSCLMTGQLPASVAEYLQAPSTWPEVDGVIPAGTRMRVESAAVHADANWSSVDYSASVLTDPFRGTTLSLLDVSRMVGYSELCPPPRAPDPAILRLCREAPGTGDR